MAANYPPPVLRTPIGGTCDANGNLTIKSIVPSRSWYGVFTAILKVSSGAPQWEIDLLGMPVGVAGGGSAVMGAIYSNPEDAFTLIVTGAAPNAVVSGGLYGFLAAEPEQLPQLGAISSGGGGGTSGALPGGQAVVKATLPAFSGTSVVTPVPIAVGGAALIGVELVGTIDASTNVSLQGTVDDVNWRPVDALAVNAANALTWWLSGTAMVFAATNNYLLVPAGGLSQIRLTWQPTAAFQATTVTLALRAAPGATVPLPRGQQLAAQSQPVVIASDQSAVPVTPFSSSLGQKTMAGSMPVVLASDQSAIPVNAAAVPETAELASYFASAAQVLKAFTAGQEFQFLVIYHPATVAELIRLRKLVLTLMSVSAASNLDISLRRLNGGTAPSGGTGLTISIANNADAALSGSDVIQTLPATPGTIDAGSAAMQSYSMGITAAATAPSQQQPVVLYDHEDSPNRKPPTVRASVAEGWAVLVKSSGAATIIASLSAEFTLG